MDDNPEELQNDLTPDEYLEEVEDQVEEPDQQQAADSEPASEPEHEQNEEDDAAKAINQEAVDAAIAKQHAKYREEQRKRKALEQELESLKQRGVSNDPEPEIFQVDPYAADLNEQLKARDDSVRNHQAWQERQKQREAEKSEYQRSQEAERHQTQQQRVENYLNQAKELKISETDLNSAMSSVGRYQLGPEFAEYLMGDDKGVALTLQLSKQPALLAELSTMTPNQAILHVERTVRSKLDIKPRSGGGKPPPKRIKGKAADISDKFPLTGGKVSVE